MSRDYLIVSPSLDGVLQHETTVYEGVNRPHELLKVLDRPSGTALRRPRTDAEVRELCVYLNDIYSVFSRKLSLFVSEAECVPSDALKLQALLQEMIKVKKLIKR